MGSQRVGRRIEHVDEITHDRCGQITTYRGRLPSARTVLKTRARAELLEGLSRRKMVSPIRPQSPHAASAESPSTRSWSRSSPSRTARGNRSSKYSRA
jgi:hypothetical protein